MSDLIEYAKREMKPWFESGDEYDKLMADSVLELLYTFSNQGHSGFSAPIAIDAFHRLAHYKPFGPLTGEDDEWEECDENTYQNKRCYSVFKDKETGIAYNTESKIFSYDGGQTWFRNSDSREDITFPYTVPDNPEYIIVSEKEDSE